DAPPPPAASSPAAAGRDRLELAVAYLDLGDKDSARSLLLEVAASGDAEARAEASSLLAQIG
ncbi:MAG: FimV/HubP family polar landmark protein, partial [Pseudomonas sp.]